MNKGRRTFGRTWLAILGGGFLLQTGCLPDQFWVNAWADIVNTALVSATQPVIDAVFTPAPQ